MAQQDEEQLDGMLRGFFSDALDPCQGHAEPYFRRHLTGAGHSAWGNRTWLLGAFITGMAASVAVLWATPLFHMPVNRAPQVLETHEVQPGDALPRALPAITRVVQSHTTDEGIVVADDNTPFHVVRRRQIERTRWLDGQHNVRAEQVTPRDDLVYVKVPTY